MNHILRGRDWLKSILIIQPYIPEYRRKFFSMLEAYCKRNNLELTILAPKPDKLFQLRGDQSSDLDIVHEIQVHRIRLLGKQVDYFRLPRGLRFKDFDLVIMEQTLKNIQYPFLLLRAPKKTRIALWGHGKTVVKKKSKVEQLLQLFLTKQADFFFSYTKSGADYLAEHGFPREKITVLQNSNSSIGRIENTARHSKEIGTSPRLDGARCCYIGALESTKGIDFLIKAIPIIKDAFPKFQFTFIGDGPARQLVADFVEMNSYASWLGFKNETDLDEISHEFSLILIPGRVGLIAVDSLMLLIPIVTTSHGFHAPEYEYIQKNGTSIEINGTYQDYALEVIRLLNNPAEIIKMRENLSSLRSNHTLEVMVENFTAGLRLCFLEVENQN
jgi:glycosyltransferase involved in cell wall biosynthesis